VPLSTSSSNSRIPHAPYRIQWFLAFVIFIAMLGGSEAFWRHKGYLPSITDGKLLWGFWRDKVYSEELVKKIVILGGSRAQLGLTPDILHRKFPRFAAIHLAVDGTPPLAIFKDLAEDARFDGIIVCSMLTGWFSESALQIARPWVDHYYSEFSGYGIVDKLANMKIQIWLQKRFVIFSSELNLMNQIKSKRLFSSHSRPNYLYMRPDRYRPAYYYDRLTPGQLLQLRKKIVRRDLNGEIPVRVMSEKEFRAVLTNQIAPLVKKLNEKGGEVVFVRMPTTDVSWYNLEKMYPKAKYWDKIRMFTDAYTIHFKDYKTLSGFRCPDTSHLDVTDAPIFTSNFADILIQEDIIPAELIE